MDEDLIARWNAVVGPEDVVYHLGDFAYRCHQNRMREIFDRLNGQKSLVLGNHDKIGVVSQLKWADKPTHYREVAVDGQRIILFHYGMRVWNAMHPRGDRPGSIQLYGHSHGRLQGTNRSLDVGVDCWDFYPVTLQQIRERMATLPEHKFGEPEDDQNGAADADA